MVNANEKAKNAALQWHFGLVTEPPSDHIGREYLAQVLPKSYRLEDGILVYFYSLLPFLC